RGSRRDRGRDPARSGRRAALLCTRGDLSQSRLRLRHVFQPSDEQRRHRHGQASRDGVGCCAPARNDVESTPMGYILTAIAALIFLHGLTRLSPAPTRRSTPWGALLVWAVVFASGLAVWLAFGSSRAHAQSADSGYKLVENWVKLPTGMFFGSKDM